ncbi:GYF domain-containing protein [Abeliophyllum distichum]|uniref:GYF domain-containing protein n=1 Tax=Abeliophyllum distichum TaxID=126358 RepID=A0ABD1W167_9LAMI
MEPRIQHHLQNERQKRELDVNMTREDPSLWMSAETNDDNSKRLLMELLHQKSDQQSSETLDGINGTSHGRRVPSGGPPHGRAAEGMIDVLGSGGSLFRSHSGALVKGEPFASVTNESSEVPALDAKEGIVEQAVLAAIDRGEPVNILSRHTSLGSAGENLSIHNEKIGSIDTFTEEAARDKLPIATSKRPENILLRRPPVSRNASSLERLSELSSDIAIKGKNHPTSSPSEGVRRETRGNLENSESLVTDKKEVQFRHTTSSGDGDVLETSFSDMLKNNAKKPASQESHAAGAGSLEPSEGTHGARSSRKKGKKGRQIDPSLLGFKVTSNRIMMGEIQGLED